MESRPVGQEEDSTAAKSDKIVAGANRHRAEEQHRLIDAENRRALDYIYERMQGIDYGVIEVRIFKGCVSNIRCGDDRNFGEFLRERANPPVRDRS